jgi:hypothetical protein
MNVRVNVPAIVQAMREKDWGVTDTCAKCRVNHKTLSKVLKGQFPKRLDAWYRLLNGLGITEKEALIAGAPQAAKLYFLPGRRRDPEVA